jgi:hypothetical protein
MDVLEIEVNGQFLELYEDEKIVQSLNVLNINDITKRGSEYTNAFKVPRTNVNSNIIEFADFVTSNSAFPFVKNECSIYINGYQFKKGYLQLIEVAKDLTLRFYTGNIGFYNKLKAAKLNQLQLTDLDHTWSLTNVVSSRFNSEGYIYPLIDYNGVSNTGNSVDVRRLLPAYFDKTLMEAVCEENGYTLVNNISGSTLTEYESGILPTTKKNPTIPQEILDANKYIAGPYGIELGLSFVLFNIFQNSSFGYTTNGNIPIRFPYPNLGLGANPNLYDISTGVNIGTGVFTAQYGGNYKVTTDFFIDYQFTESWTSSPNKTTNVYLSVELEVNGVVIQNIATNNFSTTTTNPTNYSFDTHVNNNTTIYLNVGDQLKIVYYAQHSTVVGSYLGAISLQVGSGIVVSESPADYEGLKIELQPELTYGSELKAQYLLAEVSQADYFKDTCLRYCLIPTVNEDTKQVTLNLFNTIKNNIANAPNWTALVDETNEPAITYELSDYAQANSIKHKADKSILTDVIGSDYVIRLNNENLLAEKDLYTSPFAASEDVVRLGTNKMIFIDLHDGTSFTKDVQPRRCYIEKVNVSIDYTDGTNTTSVTTSVPLTWFIRADKNYNMGFGNNQMSRYSNDLISILQGLRIIKINIKLTLIDILNLNYFYPVYLKQYNAYFFVSNINQFDYTSNEATEVELIKLT